MNHQKRQSAGKHPLLAYFLLFCYICIAFATAWFSSEQNRIALQIREDFREEKNQLTNEIRRLQLEEARLTSAKRIHAFARELQMVQPSPPVRNSKD
jgi:cell division protein FtsL